jgi:hypothetical protein
VPGHSSFPSGHATQAHLMALCVNAIFTRLSTPVGGNPPNWTPANADVMKQNLTALALRIRRNREIAGLHFKSDSEAGEALAAALFDVLSGVAPLPTIQIFDDTLNDAANEWRV